MWLTEISGCAVFVALAVPGATGDQTLLPMHFTPISTGSVVPEGWLLSEMQSMARGIPGHMFTDQKGGDGRQFYSYVKESTWLQNPDYSPSEYSDLNEAFPYWFNGLVPLAYTLGDESLKAQVTEAAKTVLDLQTEGGWLGPEDHLGEPRNLWGRYPFLLGLTQLADADAGWTGCVLDSVRRFMALTNTMLRDNGQGYLDANHGCDATEDCTWGQVRVADFVLTMQWLLDNHPSDQDSLLWDNMQMLQNMNRWKWENWYTAATYQQVVEDASTSNPVFPYLHGVNVGQGLKAPAVVRRFTHDNSLLGTATDAVNWTFKYHGSPSGSVLGDEILRDDSTYIGSELCTAVETGYSLAYLYQATGDKTYGDLAERTYFNALAVQTASDSWGHQYMDQPNQPYARYEEGWDLFTTANSGAATVYGLEPVYPCCTVNHPQGFPKFLTNSWAKIGDTGLANTLLGPSRVSTTVEGGNVNITCSTNYPFTSTIHYESDADIGYTLYVRIPSWWMPEQSSIVVGTGSPAQLMPDPMTGMHQFALGPGRNNVMLHIGLQPRTETKKNGAISVYVGNLLYALDVGSHGSDAAPHAYNNANGSGMDSMPFKEVRDYSFVSTEAWNVAIDPKTMVYHGIGDDDVLDESVWTYGGAKTYIEVQGCEVDWPMKSSLTPDDPPASPTCTSGKKTYALKPYGALKVHMSVLPVVDVSGVPSTASRNKVGWH
ncbi:hypothetical protein F5Y15DRAFT_409353 [Xylariaceae sp. FL0016]|nr:hypothetical protein F5Y15DRAFT_409353 [Xylariaceae sp. FL0016]